MPMRWLELIAQNPGSATILFISSVLFISYLAILLVNIKRMQEVMVTKQDLELALHKWVEELNDRYVTRREWEITKEARAGRMDE